ncbi:MAG: PaaI family thioesterase [Promethearchaeota archaeon]
MAPEDSPGGNARLYEHIARRINEDGISKAFGIVMEEVREGYARARMTLKRETCANFLGVPHGAALYALADQCFAAASNSHGTASVALQISVNYLRMVDYGEELVAEGKEVHSTRRTGLYHMDVENAKGDLVAQMQGTVYRLGKSIGEFLSAGRGEE